MKALHDGGRPDIQGETRAENNDRDEESIKEISKEDQDRGKKGQ